MEPQAVAKPNASRFTFHVSRVAWYVLLVLTLSLYLLRLRSDGPYGKDFTIFMTGATVIATIAAAYGVIAIDTPYADIEDEEGIAAETEFVKAIGFKAKFAVHPKQVTAINRIFAPTEAELAEAKRIIEEFDAGVSAGRGAVSVGGRMVDGPIAARARLLIELADQIAGRE